MVDRMGPLRTVAGQFVEGMNDGRISDGAVVVSAADLGVPDVPIGAVEGAPTVPGDMVSVVVPAGARAIKIAFAPIERTMVLVPGEAFGEGPIRLAGAGEATDRVLDLRELLPGQEWTGAPSEGGTPGSEWLTQRARDDDIEISVEKVERTRLVLAPSGGTPWSEAFGVSAESLPGRSAESGESFDPADVLVAIPGSTLLETWPEDGPPRSWPESFDFSTVVPTAAPMGGVTFGVGVFSTPSASVGGESVNPISRADIGSLLQRSETQQLLAQAGVTDLDSIQWISGPERADPSEGPSTATLLGNEAPIESFVAVVEGAAGPWGVGAHFVRVDEGDHVIVVGVHRRVVGSAEGTIDELTQGKDVVEARKLVAETAAQLDSA